MRVGLQLSICDPGRRSAVSPPTFSSVSPALGDIGGSVTITLTGTTLTGATGVTIGGTACTSVTVVNDTTVTCVTPAKAAGTYDIAVTTPGGTATLTNGFESWSPASLTAQIFVKRNYAASPWVGQSSAGSSGSRNLTEATNPPTASSGAAVFDGVNDKVANATAMSSLVSAAAGTIFACGKIVSAAAAAGNPFDDAAIWADNGIGAVGLGVNSSGLRAFLTDGSYKTRTQAVSMGSLFSTVMRWDSSNLKLKINDGSDSSVAAGAVSNVTGTLLVGCNYAAAVFGNIELRCLVSAQTALSDANCTKLHTWAQGLGYLT